ncbi:MAG: hypothetical protein BJ554DRAFT_1458 [Olpidium bornovanus]|uniref:Uncharacterized protein n=1 Tax=Olpidium bornovanus TaxID=278681 RepID=A0A8H8A0Z2_9FUNG|nr:MAG: hypothetical protein BJ554DRAFT_1458 [Olpidium bornovanus]
MIDAIPTHYKAYLHRERHKFFRNSEAASLKVFDQLCRKAVFFLRQQDMRSSLLARPSRPTHAVRVRINVPGDVKIDDVLHRLDVEPTS